MKLILIIGILISIILICGISGCAPSEKKGTKINIPHYNYTTDKMENLTIIVPKMELPIDSEEEACILFKDILVVKGDMTNITSCIAEKNFCALTDNEIMPYNCTKVEDNYNAWNIMYSCESAAAEIGILCGGFTIIDSETGNVLEERVLM